MSMPLPSGETVRALPPHNVRNPAGPMADVPGALVFDRNTFEAMGFNAPIPNPLLSGMFAEIAVGIAPEVVSIPNASPAIVGILYRAQKSNPSAPGSWMELTQSILYTDLNVNGFTEFLFTIPSADLDGKSGGSLSVIFFQKSGSTANFDLLVQDMSIRWRVSGGPVLIPE